MSNQKNKEGEYYKIVSTDSFSKSEENNNQLEKEITEIRDALRGSVGISKFGETAEQFMTRVLELLKNSQKMVTDVSRTNRELSSKLQEALDSMSKTNKLLSNKLTKILNYFAEAAEVEGAEETEIGDTISKQMSGVRSAIEALIEQNKQTHHLLKLIEKDLRTQPKQDIRPQTPQRQRQEPSASYESQRPQRSSKQERPPIEEGELPPPPFPP